MKLEEKDYLEPENIDETKVITRADLESHASLLTNRRIDMLLQAADESGAEIWSNPIFKSVINYHAILNQIYKDVFVIFENDERTGLINLMNDFNAEFKKIVNHEEAYSYPMHFKLAMLLDKIHAQMNANLQQRKYFFRESENNYRGLMGGLKYFAERYDKFIGKKKEGEKSDVQGVDAAEHEATA